MDRGKTESRGLQIDISSVMRRFIKEGFYILLVAASVAMLYGVFINFTYKDQFSATTTMIVKSRQTSNSSMRRMNASETAASFQEVINTNLLQKKVAKEMGISTLPGEIQCSLIENTNLITLTVTAASPKDVVNVMNGIIKHYDVVMDSLIGETSIQILDEMNVPYQSISRTTQWMMIGKVFVAVLILLCAVLFLYDILRDDIKNEKEVEKKLDTKLYSIIYYEKINYGIRNFIKRKKNIGLTITNPSIGFGFTETYQKIATKVEYSLGSDKQVLLVTSMNENEGKSTVAANIALTLAQRDKSVLLVDADLRKPAQYKLLGVEYPEKSKQISDLLMGKADYKQTVVYDKETRLTLLAGSNATADTAGMFDQDRLKGIFNELKNDFDYIIIDTPPLFAAADTEEFLSVAEAGLLVIQQNYSKVKDINDGIDVFRMASCELLGCVLNGVQTSPVSIRKNAYDYAYNSRYSYGYGGYGQNYGKKSRYGYGYGKTNPYDQKKRGKNQINNDKEQKDE
ncbi:MAG: polysaccharide biosynthesis tyrosine autokinase [Lachnospiraceae bacterium]|nr:polysaccharide biosynthesis tyrosine autokinase [Lachnospiraceae bacterium]